MKVTGSTWKVVIRLVLFCMVWAGLLFASCEEPCKEEVKERCNKECNRIGLCQIKSSYTPGGQFIKSTRLCRWVAKPDVTACGECTDIKRDSKGNILSKTCTVCNLCESEFECLEDSECKDPTPICDLGLCVGCRSQKDCDAKARPLCVKGECIGCEKDKDCKSDKTPQCYKNECVACRCSETHPKTPQCLKKSTGAVQCVECSEDRHCSGSKPLCDTAKNVCVAECKEDKDCKNNLKCFAGSCSECASDKDCSDPQTPVCTQGTCGCESNKDCSQTRAYPTCSITKKRCVECVSHGDCDKSFPICNALGQCEQQRCEPGKSTCAVSGQVCRKLGRRFVCAECIETQDCKDGKKCDLSCFCCK